jgi:hypothetical protein
MAKKKPAVKKTPAKPVQERQGVRLEYKRLSDLQSWDRNPKLHDIEKLQESMMRFGFANPLIEDEKSGKTLAGHGRTETLVKLKANGAPPPKHILLDKDGEWLVPVIRGLQFDNEAEAEAYLLADNRLQEIGGWDEKMLKEMLVDITDTAAALDGLGWSQKELNALVSQFDKAQVGPKPEEKLDAFIGNIMSQIAFSFEQKEYDFVVETLDELQKEWKKGNHTEVLLALLQNAKEEL